MPAPNSATVVWYLFWFLFVRDKSIHQPKALEIYCVSRLAMKAKLETGRTKSEGEERLALGGWKGDNKHRTIRRNQVMDESWMILSRRFA